MNDDQARRPLGRAFGETATQFASLMKLDLRLLQEEMQQKGNDLKASGLFGAVALGCFFLGAFALVECLIFGLIWVGLAAIWAALIVGVGLCFLGFGPLYLARKTLVGWTLAPEETLLQVRGDLAAFREGIRHVGR